jgi:hypothetical protein
MLLFMLIWVPFWSLCGSIARIVWTWTPICVRIIRTRASSCYLYLKTRVMPRITRIEWKTYLGYLLPLVFPLALFSVAIYASVYFPEPIQRHEFPGGSVVIDYTQLKSTKTAAVAARPKPSVPLHNRYGNDQVFYMYAPYDTVGVYKVVDVALSNAFSMPTSAYAFQMATRHGMKMDMVLSRDKRTAINIMNRSIENKKNHYQFTCFALGSSRWTQRYSICINKVQYKTVTEFYNMFSSSSMRTGWNIFNIQPRYRVSRRGGVYGDCWHQCHIMTHHAVYPNMPSLFYPGIWASVSDYSYPDGWPEDTIHISRAHGSYEFDHHGNRVNVCVPDTHTHDRERWWSP